MYRRKWYHRRLTPKVNKLQQLAAKTPADQVKTVFAQPHAYFYSVGRLQSLLDTFKFGSNTYFLDALDSGGLLTLLQSASSSYTHRRLLTTIEVLAPFMSRSARTELTKELLVHRKFYSAASLLDLLTKDVLIQPQDPLNVQVFSMFWRSLKPEHFTALMNKIPNGRLDQTVQEILSKSNRFNYLTYDQTKVESDPQEAIRLLRDLAQIHTTLKHLPFTFTVKAEYLKELSPVLRFQFLRWAFEYELELFCRSYYYTKSSVAELIESIRQLKERNEHSKLILEPLKPEFVSDLLFSVSIRKNAEVSKWFEAYTKYYNILNGTQPISVWYN